MELTAAENNFLQKQMEGHLMEAHVALVKAGRCAEPCSDTHGDIYEAVGLVDQALERKER